MTDPTELHEIQLKVEKIADVMKDNLQKALDREEQLNNLENKSVTLERNSKTFLQKSKTISRLQCCKKYKYHLIISFILTGSLTLIGLSIAYRSK
jgi:hypothetical protein